MEISAKGIQLITEFEGYRSKAYQDSAGVWTIGYGHTGGVKKGDKVTHDQALELKANDLARFVKYVNNKYTEKTQCQFDALVSFNYNLGSMDSSIRKQVDNNDTVFIRRWYTHYNVRRRRKQDDGTTRIEYVPELGLQRRRLAEILMFLGYDWREFKCRSLPGKKIEELINTLDENEGI